MRKIEEITNRLDEWERMANAEPYSMRKERERFITKNTAAAATVSQHFIPMQQEINRLRQALGESVRLTKHMIAYKDIANAIDKLETLL